MTHVESSEHGTSLHREAARLAPPTPQERLQASRQALQAWVDKTYRPEPEQTGGGNRPGAAVPPGSHPNDPGWLGVLTDALSDVPAARIAVRWVSRWWARHPLRNTADFAAAAARELATPIAAKHPLLLVGGAFLAGGVLARLRPWRWIPVRALLSGPLRQASLATLTNLITEALNRLNRQTSSHPSPQSEAEPPSQPDDSVPRHVPPDKETKVAA